jgi:hypothetical protein
MGRQQHRLATFILSVISFMGAGCAPRKSAPAITDRPPTTQQAYAYLDRVQINEDMFRAPPGQIRVTSVSRAWLEAMRSPGDGADFDNGARPMFYMGSDADWDYYYLAEHAFGLFYRVRRKVNQQANRMDLTGDSLVWREVKEAVGARTKP